MLKLQDLPYINISKHALSIKLVKLVLTISWQGFDKFLLDKVRTRCCILDRKKFQPLSKAKMVFWIPLTQRGEAAGRGYSENTSKPPLATLSIFWTLRIFFGLGGPRLGLKFFLSRWWQGSEKVPTFIIRQKDEIWGRGCIIHWFASKSTDLNLINILLKRIKLDEGVVTSINLHIQCSPKGWNMRKGSYH